MQCPKHGKESRGLCRACFTAVCNDCFQTKNGDYFCNEQCQAKVDKVDKLVALNIASTIDKRIIVDKDFIEMRLKTLKSNSGLWFILLVGWFVTFLNYEGEYDSYWLPGIILVTVIGLLVVNVYTVITYKKYAKKS